MNWFEWADALFSFHLPIAVIIGALFLVPVLRLITAPFTVRSLLIIRAGGSKKPGQRAQSSEDNKRNSDSCDSLSHSFGNSLSPY